MLEAAEPLAGSLALSFGADGHGGVAVHLGTVSAVTPEWRSRAGGRIDRRIALDLDLGENQDGGPVLDASGALIGMSTLGHQIWCSPFRPPRLHAASNCWSNMATSRAAGWA